jgi:hypothetical protein
VLETSQVYFLRSTDVSRCPLFSARTRSPTTVTISRCNG